MLNNFFGSTKGQKNYAWKHEIILNLKFESHNWKYSIVQKTITLKMFHHAQLIIKNNSFYNVIKLPPPPLPHSFLPPAGKIFKE